MSRPTIQGSLRGARLDPDSTAELIASAEQCVLSFTDPDGWPCGVVLSYVHDRDRFWFTSVADRKHVRCLRHSPRASITITNLGTDLAGRQMLTQRGEVVVHQDAATADWFYPALAARLAPEQPERVAAVLATANRVVMEFVPSGAPISHDSRRLAGDGRGGA